MTPLYNDFIAQVPLQEVLFIKIKNLQNFKKFFIYNTVKYYN